MSYQLPKRLQTLVPYQPIEGDYRIRLDANESFFTPTPKSLEEVKNQISTIPYHRYPDPYATGACQAFADYHQVPASNVVAANGSDELIGLLCGVFFDDTDQIAVFEQDFSMYRVYLETYGKRCVTLPKCADLTIDIEKTIEAIQAQNISAIIFSNPCNPTSIGMTRADVLHLVKSVDALVILDEAYMDFWNQSLLDVVTEYDNLVILKTCSKAIGLAGIRLGFAIANDRLIRVLRAAKAPYNVNILTQCYAEILLSDPDYLNRCTTALVQGTASLYQSLVVLQDQYDVIETVYKPCTNFVYLKSSQATAIHTALLEKSIAVRCFKEYLRISCGSPVENAAFITALSDILKEGLV